MAILAGASAACSAGAPEPPSNPLPPSVRVEITAPADVRSGDEVPVTLRIENADSAPATVYLQGRPTAFDIVVSDEKGRVVWRRLGGQTVPAILGVRTIPPGDALTFADAWPQRDQAGRAVPPGRYSIHGEFPTDQPTPLTSPPITLSIRPPD